MSGNEILGLSGQSVHETAAFDEPPEPAEQAEHLGEIAEGQQEAKFEYHMADGTVAQADTIEEAIRSCPILSRMPHRAAVKMAMLTMERPETNKQDAPEKATQPTGGRKAEKAVVLQPLKPAARKPVTEAAVVMVPAVKPEASKISEQIESGVQLVEKPVRVLAEPEIEKPNVYVAVSVPKLPESIARHQKSVGESVADQVVAPVAKPAIIPLQPEQKQEMASDIDMYKQPERPPVVIKVTQVEAPIGQAMIPLINEVYVEAKPVRVEEQRVYVKPRIENVSEQAVLEVMGLLVPQEAPNAEATEDNFVEAVIEMVPENSGTVEPAALHETEPIEVIASAEVEVVESIDTVADTASEEPVGFTEIPAEASEIELLSEYTFEEFVAEQVAQPEQAPVTSFAEIQDHSAQLQPLEVTLVELAVFIEQTLQIGLELELELELESSETVEEENVPEAAVMELIREMYEAVYPVVLEVADTAPMGQPDTVAEAITDNRVETDTNIMPEIGGRAELDSEPAPLATSPAQNSEATKPEPHITKEVAAQLLVLLRTLGYEDPQETLRSYMERYDLAFLLQAIRSMYQLTDNAARREFMRSRSMAIFAMQDEYKPSLAIRIGNALVGRLKGSWELAA